MDDDLDRLEEWENNGQEANLDSSPQVDSLRFSAPSDSASLVSIAHARLLSDS